MHCHDCIIPRVSVSASASASASTGVFPVVLFQVFDMPEDQEHRELS